ncbi:AMIN-like domain-containing (lipo)protein [Kocuria nitroreducens]|uniref:AMIN-like domain-containing (lipo)protein n=1 Tax=Kocuria nitroreducens TaxID=3058914 RepID=UPI0036DF008B
MKKLISWLAALVLAMGLGLIAPSSATAATPYCGITWGSTAKARSGEATTPRYPHVTDVRAGQHRCFDRLVIDLDGKVRGYDVRYKGFEGIGSGDPIPLHGTDLVISVNAPAYDGKGRATYEFDDPGALVDVHGYRTFRQVAWGGSFEARTSVGLGVRARLPFRVFVLEGPGKGSRLVVDVAHRW